MAMTRVKVDGETLNLRTARMLARVEARTGLSTRVVQGSYSSGPNSAGTHEGGGAVDLSVHGFSREQILDLVWQMRCCGFASYFRPNNGIWDDHIHAIAIGDKEMSPEARAQVVEYYAGDDALAGDGKDPHRRPDPIPVWPIPLPDISLSRATKQFTATGEPRKVIAVAKIQRLLNRRLGTDLLVDGKAGPKTRAAYKRWETTIGSPSADGVPGEVSLKKLVAGFYRVTK